MKWYYLITVPVWLLITPSLLIATAWGWLPPHWAAGRVYGERCSGLSAKSDPLGCSLRTYLRSACEALTELSLRWKESVTPAGHWWLVLGRRVHRTKGIGYGLWPTATKADADGHAQTAANPTPRQTGGATLADAARQDWPTPNKMDGDRGASKGGTEKHTGGMNLRESCNGQAAQANHSTTGKPRGSLNAAWVMQLQDWPDDFVAELTRHCYEWQATVGCSRAVRSSTSGSSKPKAK